MAMISQSPKAGQNKAGLSDFRNRRFEPDTVLSRQKKKINKGLRRFHRAKTRKMWKMRARKRENAENVDDWL